jgi:hypothetical protein
MTESALVSAEPSLCDRQGAGGSVDAAWTRVGAQHTGQWSVPVQPALIDSRAAVRCCESIILGRWLKRFGRDDDDVLYLSDYRTRAFLPKDVHPRLGIDWTPVLASVLDEPLHVSQRFR